MDAVPERYCTYVRAVASRNFSVSRGLVAPVHRAVSRSRALCEAVHERRRHPNFFHRFARYARARPELRRFLPLCGADGDLVRIETEERPEGMVAHVAGEVDLANVNRLRDAIQPAVTDCRNLIVDMSSLRYIDATGLRVLIKAAEELHRNGCQMIVVGASSVIAKVMRILHLDRLASVVSVVDEAMDLLRLEYRESAADQ